MPSDWERGTMGSSPFLERTGSIWHPRSQTIKHMFGFCQESGGRYFGDATEAETAAQLKKLAAEARGAAGKAAELGTLEDFFKVHFGPGKASP